MYKLEEAVNALLDNMPIKKIARMQRISKNTVKKYQTHPGRILDAKPWLRDDLESVIDTFND